MRSFRLGSVFAIELRIDASWFVLFFLLIWTFSQGVFPEEIAGLPVWAYYVLGVTAAVLFFASLLAHELSHSLVARRKGIGVEGITLFIFGGMARTRMDARRPGDEFVIAGVGPLSSLVIALIFAGLSWLCSHLGSGRAALALAGLTGYLAFVNLMLAAFNLLPGFPLDGGRLLRSAVWKATGSVRKATRVAAIGGTVLAVALIAIGLWQVTRGQLLNGIWLALIGWFLLNASRASARIVEVEVALDEIPARRVMNPNPATVPPDLTLAGFLARSLAGQAAYPVVDGGARPLGLVTASQALAVPEAERDRRTVVEVMIPISPELQVGREESLRQVLEKLGRGVPVLVTRDGRLEGMISAQEVANWDRRAAWQRRP